MSTAISPLDYVVLFAYVAGVFGLGCWFVRKSANTEEFMAAGRSLPGWVVGLSIFGTYVSSISFLANPGKSFAGNWNPFVFSLSLPIAAVIAVTFFVPFYRKSGEISAYTHLERRFGPWARMYAVVCYLLTQLGRTGTILYLVALALAPLTGWDVVTIILVVGVLVTVYTLLGGIEAVIWTDVVQSVVLTAGILVAVIVLMVRMPGGTREFNETARDRGKFSLGEFHFSLFTSDEDSPTKAANVKLPKADKATARKPSGSETFWVVLIYGLFINLQNFGIDQSYVQRYITAKSDADARRSVWLGALLYIPISAFLFFIGTALFAFYSGTPERLPVNAAGEVQADRVFPMFIVEELPAGLTGLLIAAILAAAMSSVDSSLNCSATLVLQDVYRRYVRPDADERRSMRVLYSMTLLFGLLGTATALAMIGVKSALDAWWKIAGLCSGGMLGLFLLGMMSRAKNAAAAAGVTCGVLTIVWMALSPTDAWPAAWMSIASPFSDLLPIVFGTLAVFGVGVGISALNRAVTGSRESSRV